MGTRARAVGYSIAAGFLVLGLAAASRLAGRDWHTSRESLGLAPDPKADPEAVVQVYAARASGWHGLFGVHTWVAVRAAHPMPPHTRSTKSSAGGCTTVIRPWSCMRAVPMHAGSAPSPNSSSIDVDPRQRSSSSRSTRRRAAIRGRMNIASGRGPTRTPSSPGSRAPCRAWTSTCLRRRSARTISVRACLPLRRASFGGAAGNPSAPALTRPALLALPVPSSPGRQSWRVWSFNRLNIKHLLY